MGNEVFASASGIPLLVVSRQCRTADAIMQYIQKFAEPFFPVVRASSTAEARRIYASDELLPAEPGTPCAVVINSPLCDGNGVSLARELTGRGGVVLLIVSADLYREEARAAACDGVFVLPRPVDESVMWSAIWLLISSCRRLCGAAIAAAHIEDKLDELKIIDRAKWLLIDYLKMSESQAHRYIEKQAMDLRITRLEAAKNILKTYLG